MKVTLFIPVLNELEAMKTIMPQIKREWVDQILFVDGGSTDGTQDYVRQHGFELYVQKKKGLRYAFMEAIDLMKGDIVISFSPDGNSISELIPPLIEKMKEGYDMVIVSRYADGAKSYDDDAVTAFGNWLFTKTVNVLHGSKYTDALVMYRAFRKDIIFQLDLHKEESYTFEEKLFRTRMGWEPLMSVRAAKRKLKVADIPGDEPARIGGARKLQVIRWGAAYYFQFFKEKFFWR